MFVSAALS